MKNGIVRKVTYLDPMLFISIQECGKLCVTLLPWVNNNFQVQSLERKDQKWAEICMWVSLLIDAW